MENSSDKTGITVPKGVKKTQTEEEIEVYQSLEGIETAGDVRAQLYASKLRHEKALEEIKLDPTNRGYLEQEKLIMKAFKQKIINELGFAGENRSILEQVDERLTEIENALKGTAH